MPSTQQFAYVQNRKSSKVEDCCLILLKLPISDKSMVTMDFEKTFDQNFIPLIEIILKNQDLFVINGEITAKYFKLNRGARQGDPI